MTLPASLPSGQFELAAGLAAPGSDTSTSVSLGSLTVQTADIERREPDLRARVHAAFANGAQLIGYDLKARRARPGDNLDLTLVWRAGTLMKGDQLLTLALMDEGGKLISQWESEPAGASARPLAGPPTSTSKMAGRCGCRANCRVARSALSSR